MNINILVNNTGYVLSKDVKGGRLAILEFADENFLRFQGMRTLINADECSVSLSKDCGSYIFIHSPAGWDLNIPAAGIYQTFCKALVITSKHNDRGIFEWCVEACGAWVFVRIPSKPSWIGRLCNAFRKRRKPERQLPAFEVQLTIGQHRKYAYASNDVKLAERIYACLAFGA